MDGSYSNFQIASVSTKSTSLDDGYQVCGIDHRGPVNSMGCYDLLQVLTNGIS